MRRYFFHTNDGKLIEDREGALFADDDAAKVEAARILAKLVSDRPADIWRDDQFKVTLTDALGMTLGVLDLWALTPARLRDGPTKDR